jgi:hypothetical protein
MQRTNGYKWFVPVIGILHPSVKAFYIKETGSLRRDSFIFNIERYFWISFQNFNSTKEDLSHEEVAFARCVGCIPRRLR